MEPDEHDGDYAKPHWLFGDFSLRLAYGAEERGLGKVGCDGDFYFWMPCVSSNPPVSASDGSTRQVEQSNGLPSTMKPATVRQEPECS